MASADHHHRAGQIVAWIRSHASGAAQLRIDSRDVARGDVFLALPGRRDDGRRHVADAVARGAAAVVIEDQGAELPQCGVPLLRAAHLARHRFGVDDA